MSIIHHENMNKVKAKVLYRAAEIIEEFGWVRGWFAKDKNGITIDVDEPRYMTDAKGYCMWGAVYRAERELSGDKTLDLFIDKNMRVVKEEGLDAKWNDRNRNKQAVVNRLNKIAKKYENMD